MIIPAPTTELAISVFLDSGTPGILTDCRFAFFHRLRAYGKCFQDRFPLPSHSMIESVCKCRLPEGAFQFFSGSLIAACTFVNNGELVPSARSNCTTFPEHEYRPAG